MPLERSARIARILALSEPRPSEPFSLVEVAPTLALPHPSPPPPFRAQGGLPDNEFWAQPREHGGSAPQPGSEVYAVGGEVMSTTPAMAIPVGGAPPREEAMRVDAPARDPALYQARRAQFGGLCGMMGIASGVGIYLHPGLALPLGLAGGLSAGVGMLCCCWAFPRLHCAE